MPILRAGPFASGSDSFVDEPSTPVLATLPVNCATNDWLTGSASDRAWKAFVDKQALDNDDPADDVNTQTYDGRLNSTELLDDNFFTADIIYAFKYQAALETGVQVSAIATADTGGGTDPITGDPLTGTSRVRITVDGSVIVDQSDTDAESSVTVNQFISMPVSVVPKEVKIEVLADADFNGDAPDATARVIVS